MSFPLKSNALPRRKLIAQSEFSNQTNLALKGIIGIEAMSKIADLTGHSDESSTDHDTATSYIDQWQKLAVVPQDGNTPAHTNLAYNDAGSHGTFNPLKPPSHQCKPSARQALRQPHGMQVTRAARIRDPRTRKSTRQPR